MLLVAAVALLMGVAAEFRRYRMWAFHSREERNVRFLATWYDSLAASYRKDGDIALTESHARAAAEYRDHQQRYAQGKRRYERTWYRYLGDGPSPVDEMPTMPLAGLLRVQ
jgi:hypothetical protein